MSPKENFNSLFVAVVTVTALLIPTNHAEYCPEGQETCLTEPLLRNASVVTIVMTNDPQPEQLCQRFQRTSISEDNNVATYDVTFRNASCDGTPIDANATLEVEGNTTLRVTYDNESESDLQSILYVVPGNCFVGQSNRTGQTLYMFKFIPGQPDDCSCIQKFKELSGGKVTILRDQRICKDIPAEP
uniref:Putative secreted protein n=1 Tax=Amblyomma triste TaxID=251400 RepID=A0A023G580_AMBTT